MLVPVEALISERLASVVQVEALPVSRCWPCPFQQISTSSVRFTQPQLLRPPPLPAILSKRETITPRDDEIEQSSRAIYCTSNAQYADLETID